MGQNEISELYSNDAITNQATNDEICSPDIERLSRRHEVHVRKGAESRQLI